MVSETVCLEQRGAGTGILRFDGIYMDSKVYVNGQMVREWKYGYSAFETEITAALVDGENEILVSVDFQAPNSRWYSVLGFTGMSGFAGRRQSILWQTDVIFLPKRSGKRSGASLFMQKP